MNNLCYDHDRDNCAECILVHERLKDEAGVAVVLTDDELLVLAKVLDSIRHEDTVFASVRDLDNFDAVRAKISEPAEALVHASRAARR